MSDIMDEFEFKPLTKGLGFHKKPATNSPNASFGTEDIRETPSPFSPTLPRTPAEKAPLVSDLPMPSVDEILKTLNQKKRPQIVNRIDSTPVQPVLKPSAWDASAFLLDMMLVLAMNLICIILLLLTTKVDLFTNLYKPQAESMIYLSLGALFLSVVWIYLVTTRMFLGSTLGEWVFDQRLGFPKETGTALYSLLVMSRATLVVFSGLVLFPILSLIFGRDILGQLMGLELMKKS